MGIFDFFRKKNEMDPEVEADVCRRYIRNEVSADEVLDAIVEKFVKTCTSFQSYTDYNIRQIKKYNEDAAPFAEEMSAKMASGEDTGVPEKALIALLRFNKNEKAARLNSLLVTRDIIVLYLSFEMLARYVGTGLIIKPDPAFDIFKAPKDSVLDFIMSRKEAYYRGYNGVRKDTYPDAEGVYYYPDPPTREQLGFVYDVMMEFYRMLKIPLVEYTDEGVIKGSENLKFMIDMTNLKWNDRLRPMVNPKNGQLSLPDENGVYHPAEPDYIGIMKEIDFHGVI